jgi:hypothetical protein
LNAVQQGLRRDREIIDTVEQCKALDTMQIASLLFCDIKTGSRKAQERLQKLHEAKRLKRCRLSVNEPYAYYLGRQHGRIEHLIGVNWVRVWLISTLKTWERFVTFEYEQDYKTLQCDAFYAVANTMTGEHRFCFVEIDRTESNKFDKIAKYNELYHTGGYMGSWWMPMTKRFPSILIVTTSETRAKAIKQLIVKENKFGLMFTVRLLDDIKQEAIPWPLR